MLQTLAAPGANDLFLENFKYPLAVLGETPASYILMYLTMHLQRLSLLFFASSSRKRYWNWTLPRIKAQIELSIIFVYDYKISTGSSSARNSHLAQGGRTTMQPMPANWSFFVAEQNITIKNKTTTEPLKEGVTTIFRVVYLYTDSIFFAIILFCIVM